MSIIPTITGYGNMKHKNTTYRHIFVPECSTVVEYKDELSTKFFRCCYNRTLLHLSHFGNRVYSHITTTSTINQFYYFILQLFLVLSVIIKISNF